MGSGQGLAVEQPVGQPFFPLNILRGADPFWSSLDWCHLLFTLVYWREVNVGAQGRVEGRWQHRHDLKK